MAHLSGVGAEKKEAETKARSLETRATSLSQLESAIQGGGIMMLN